MRYLLIKLIVLVVAAVGIGQTTKHPGIDLYKAGKNAEAVRSLSQAVKEKNTEKNAELWNFLGLAYFGVNDNKNARKAFEKAVKLDASNSQYHSNYAYAHLLARDLRKARSEADKATGIDPKNLNAMIVRGMANFWQGDLTDAERDADLAISTDERFSQGYILKSTVLMGRLGERVAKGATIRKELALLEGATKVLNTGRQKCADDACRRLIDEEMGDVQPFLEYFSKKPFEPGDPKPEPEPGVTPLRITKKFPPGYTDQARSAGVEGTISLAVLFGASGKVESVIVLKKLGAGLDEAAIRAARRIEFEPMRRDGIAVSVVKIVEFSFDIR